MRLRAALALREFHGARKRLPTEMSVNAAFFNQVQEREQRHEAQNDIDACHGFPLLIIFAPNRRRQSAL